MKFDQLIDRIKEIEECNDLQHSKVLAHQLVNTLTNLQVSSNKVYLTKCGKGIIETIRTIREYTSLGLKECKDIVDSVTNGRRAFVGMLPLKQAYNFRIDIERNGGSVICVPDTNIANVLYE